LGCEVLAVDVDAKGYKADVPFRNLDLNDPAFPSFIGPREFDLVTAVEVIEHLDSPVAFLRNVRSLLSARGVAVITTPNVENLPARLKYLLTGKLRSIDERGDPEHISPIFWDLLVRQLLPRAQLTLLDAHLYPSGGYEHTRPALSGPLSLAARLLGGRRLVGDSHLLVLGRKQ
jgi:SAM-dependent methyltransferase